MKWASPLLVILLATTTHAGDARPAKLPTEARLDLAAEPAVGALTMGQALAGDAQLARMTWKPEAERDAGYVVMVPVTRFGWTEVAIRFTPTKTGKVTLTLMGPWEEANKGQIYRQEVLWDDVKAEGTRLDNGSFEEAAGWQVNGGQIIDATPGIPAVEGKRYARTWHDGKLSTTLAVTGGMPVTLRFKTRAVVPPGVEEMARITSRDTPAHRAAKRFRRGVNFGNYLEVPPSQNWALTHTADDVRRVEEQGFDHIRLPIGWHNYGGPAPDFKLDPAIYAKVDTLVDAATKRGLAVMINVHHFDAFTSDPKGRKAQFFALWEQIAQHYAKAPDSVAFELLNEPKDAATTIVLNPIYAEALKIVRKTNPNRTVFVGPGQWNQSRELAHLRLPDDDQNLITTVHSYDPFAFTHQGASWAGPDAQLKGIRYPGPPEKPLVVPAQLKLSGGAKDWLKRYNTLPTAENPSSPRAFGKAIRLAKEWSDYYGRPVHLGEFGCYIDADPESRARFLRDFRVALDEANMGWALWDWKAGFRYWNADQNRPAPGLREALLPKRTEP